MPWFYARREGDHAVVEGADASHLVRSLRARKGEQIEVIDQAASAFLVVRLESVSPERVEGAILAERPHQTEPRARVTLAIANLPSPALELLFSRCTEAGAFAFHILQADRSVARAWRPERWATICREAAMLAGRLQVPAIAGPSTFDEVLASAEHPVLLVRGAPVRLADLREPRDVTLLVGPEGGWSEREAASVPVRADLGPLNLRAETAALVALAIALAGRE